MHKSKAYFIFVFCTIIIFGWSVSCDKHSDKNNISKSKRSEPPQPNFYEPFDYVNWTNEYLAKGKPAGSETIYDEFWRLGQEGKMPDPPDDIGELLLTLTSGPIWKAGEYPRMEAYVDNVKDYLAIFKKAARKPEFTLRLLPDTDYPKHSGIYPWKISGQYATCIMITEAWKFGPDQNQRLLDAWEIGLKHANHLLRTKDFFCLRLGCDNVSIVYRSIRAALAQGLIEPEHIKNVYKLLEKYSLEPRILSDMVYLKWAGAFSEMQCMYPHEKLNKEYARKIYGLDVNTLKKFPINLDSMINNIDDYYFKYMNAVSSPLDMKVIEKAKEIEERRRMTDLNRYPLYNMLFLRLHIFLLKEIKAICEYRATNLILHIHDFYNKNSSWPRSLSELGTKLNQNILIDPYSESEFKYLSQNESFKLYSVGENENDDKGNEDDLTFWHLSRTD